MSNFIKFVCGTSSQRNGRRKVAVIVLYVTVVFFVITVAGLIISMVSDSAMPKDDVQEPDNVGVSSVSFNLGYNATKKGALLLVNNTSSAYDFNVNNDVKLVSISEDIPSVDGVPLYSCAAGMRAEKTAFEALKKMLTDFHKNASDKEAAKKLVIEIAYRSLEEQQSGGSFKPGHSDFHTGMLFNLMSGNSDLDKTTYQWIYDNAHRYGFIARYPVNKAAHTGDVRNLPSAFRYVGVPHSTYIYEKNICLEEYEAEIRQYTKENPLSIVSGGINYKVFYVKASAEGVTSFEASSNATVSGDNNGGFIVTYRG